MICKNPEDAPDQAEYIELQFEKGIPVALNGKKLGAVEMVTALNEVGARNAVGIDDIVENRLVGMKSRGVYETPGGRVLYTAHSALETLVLDRATMHYKAEAAIKYADLVYDGMWYSPLREALAAFVEQTQQVVTGMVRLKLYKGTCKAAGLKSPYSLYSEEFATFGEDEVYNQKDAEGFINLFGLPLKVKALTQDKAGK
jgi:argininosuccinate synthase